MPKNLIILLDIQFVLGYNLVVKALKEIGYEGDFTYEADSFLEKFPVDFFAETAEFMCKIGRYLIKQMGEN